MKSFEEKCKEIAKKYPNDQKLGYEIRKLIHTYSCCSLKENQYKSGDKTICKVCGKIIN